MQDSLATQRWWRRPRLSLSLRALMVIVLLLGCWLGWFVRSAQIQRAAVAAIIQGGGRVWYDWELPRSRVQSDGEFRGGTPMRKQASPWPKWLFDRLGPDYFGVVKQVAVGNKDPDVVMARVGSLSRLELLNFIPDAPVTDKGITSVRRLTALKMFAVPIRGGRLTGASLENLKGLTGLREILLTSKPVLSDADLIHLKGLTGLQHLQLSSSPQNTITDAGLANIKDMLDMRTLNMRGPVTSAGMVYLRGMTRLHDLWIPATRVDDLAPIRNLTGLKYLHLSSTPMTDDGLAPVAGFTSLSNLFLADTPITDAGLKHLRGLTSLTQLELSKTRITDAGLANLAGLVSLQNLGLAGTGVTDAGLAQLAKLQSLATLNIADTKVTDDGLKHLTGLKGLSRLTLQGSAVTPAAVTSLQNTMPQLRIQTPPQFRALPKAARR
jgi:Leucine-rich repeat (LRR) protein